MRATSIILTFCFSLLAPGAAIAHDGTHELGFIQMLIHFFSNPYHYGSAVVLLAGLLAYGFYKDRTTK